MLTCGQTGPEVNPESTCGGTCRRHVFRENSQEQRVVPFPSLLISSHQLPPTTPHTLRLPARRDADILSPGWMFASVQKHTEACVRLEHWSLADAAFNSRARQQSLSKRGNGLHFRVWWCRHVSFPIDQMDTTEGSEVWVILKDLHPGGLPGHRLRDVPVV